MKTIFEVENSGDKFVYQGQNYKVKSIHFAADFAPCERKDFFRNRAKCRVTASHERQSKETIFAVWKGKAEALATL